MKYKFMEKKIKNNRRRGTIQLYECVANVPNKTNEPHISQNCGPFDQPINPPIWRPTFQLPRQVHYGPIHQWSPYENQIYQSDHNRFSSISPTSVSIIDEYTDDARSSGFNLRPRFVNVRDRWPETDTRWHRKLPNSIVERDRSINVHIGNPARLPLSSVRPMSANKYWRSTPPSHPPAPHLLPPFGQRKFTSRLDGSVRSPMSYTDFNGRQSSATSGAKFDNNQHTIIPTTNTSTDSTKDLSTLINPIDRKSKSNLPQEQEQQHNNKQQQQHQFIVNNNQYSVDVNRTKISVPISLNNTTDIAEVEASNKARRISRRKLEHYDDNQNKSMIEINSQPATISTRLIVEQQQQPQTNVSTDLIKNKNLILNQTDVASIGDNLTRQPKQTIENGNSTIQVSQVTPFKVDQMGVKLNETVPKQPNTLSTKNSAMTVMTTIDNDQNPKAESNSNNNKNIVNIGDIVDGNDEDVDYTLTTEGGGGESTDTEQNPNENVRINQFSSNSLKKGPIIESKNEHKDGSSLVEKDYSNRDRGFGFMKAWAWDRAENYGLKEAKHDGRGKSSTKSIHSEDGVN
ncbi:hypothetical protein BLOT_014202 [Blomia tropicalis]|nr:hypothetical protein BLOT_014202 [Blomia tropicalis]